MHVNLRIPRSILLVPVAVGSISHIFVVKVDTLLRLILVLLAVFIRQSAIDFGIISHIFSMKMDSDPDGELLDVWQSLGFCRILRHFSHSFRMDVSAHFSALDDEEFFVIEGCGWRGHRESDSQLFCHLNSMHALAFPG